MADAPHSRASETLQGASEAGGEAVHNLAPHVLKSWLDEGRCVLIDVREDFEHAEERIETSTLHPLSVFDAGALHAAHPGDRIVLHCRSGKRSLDAARRLAAYRDDVFHLAGGIEAWRADGFETHRPVNGSFPVMRQVQIAAGGLVATGVLLGVLVSPWLLVVPAFVGCGLIFAGITGWCGMAKLLAAMPWNRRS